MALDYKQVAVTTESGIEVPQPRSRAALLRRYRGMLGVTPLILYLALFLVVPALSVVGDAFRSSSGSFTLANMAAAFHGVYLESFRESLELSLVAGLIASILGTMVALAIATSESRVLRSIVSSGAAVFANTGGVPLAFSFIATVGNFGLITVILTSIGYNPYDHGFSLYSILGLTIVYQYFLLPLMVLIMIPAVEALKREWVDAADTLGAKRHQFWRHVAFPILLSPFVAGFLVMFMDAFAAYATAEALTSGTIPLVPIQLGALISGNVITNQTHLGDALGAGMIGIVLVAGTLYFLVQRRATRWLR